MNRALRSVAIGVALALAFILGRVLWLSFNPGPDIHKPRGYDLIAKLFVRHRWLTLDEDTKVSLAENSGPEVAGAYRHTFLRNDGEEFNGGKTWIFEIENRQIKGVDATRHNVVLPYGKIEQWEGSLRYRPGELLEASMRGVGVDIQIDALTRPLTDQVKPESVVVPGDMSTTPVHSARGEVVNVFGGPNDVYLGKLSLAGDSVIMNNRRSRDTQSMWISGSRLDAGNRAWLAPGDLLKLEWRAGGIRPTRYALLWSAGGRSADIISAPCAINGKWSRCPEEPAMPFASDVISTLDSGMAGKTTSARKDFDVVLTLDRKLNGAVQSALERDRQAENGAPTKGIAARRRETRAAVTVMDALTGDILALASYPTRAALARVDLPPETKSRLLRNHNFSRQAIGSVAKVLFGAAIADADPRLLALELHQHGGEEVDTVAGITIDPPIESHAVSTGGDSTVNFREFIGHSSNEYAALLLTVACATKRGQPLPSFTGPPLPVEGRYSIGSQTFDRAPSPTTDGEIRLNLRQKDDHVVADTLSTLEAEPWANSFRNLFDVEKIVNTAIERRPAAEGDQMIDTAVWKPVLNQLYGDNVPANHPLRAVGFERENLALNLTPDYRKQLLSLMYGGAAARFTNPKLCEMFSRLVTGRKVERSLVLGVPAAGADVPVTARQFPPLGIDPAARDEMLRAMTSVADGGTAAALFNMLADLDRKLKAKNQALGFYSKTGSPRNIIAVPSGLSRAVNALISSGAVALDARGVLTYRGIPVTDDTEKGTDPASLAALRANVQDVHTLNKFGITTRLAHDALLLYNIEPLDRRNELFTTGTGRVFSMNGVRELETTGAVYVFTIAIYPGDARRSERPLDVDGAAHAPLRAWSVAINIEGQGKSSEVAVPFAKSLINEVLWPALQR
jgi:hypothetical protein